MSQRTRTAKHKNLHPEDEQRRKDRQRQKEKLFRFHIRRAHLGIAELPACIDTSTNAFQRVYDAYMSEVGQEVEVS